MLQQLIVTTFLPNLQILNKDKCDVYLYSSNTGNMPYPGQLLTYGVFLGKKSSDY